jgi:hypothetical protein
MNKHIAHKFYTVTATLSNNTKYNKVYFAESREILAETIAYDLRMLNLLENHDLHMIKYVIETATEKEILLYIVDSLEYEEQIEMIEKLYR